MAKNKNQNRQREQRAERENPASENQEQAKSSTPEEHPMPGSTQSARRQQKRFGHN